jgi:hypothetical protein
LFSFAASFFIFIEVVFTERSERDDFCGSDRGGFCGQDLFEKGYVLFREFVLFGEDYCEFYIKVALTHCVFEEG